MNALTLANGVTLPYNSLLELAIQTEAESIVDDFTRFSVSTCATKTNRFADNRLSPDNHSSPELGLDVDEVEESDNEYQDDDDDDGDYEENHYENYESDPERPGPGPLSIHQTFLLGSQEDHDSQK